MTTKVLTESKGPDAKLFLKNGELVVRMEGHLLTPTAANLALIWAGLSSRECAEYIGNMVEERDVELHPDLWVIETRSGAKLFADHKLSK